MFFTWRSVCNSNSNKSSAPMGPPRTETSKHDPLIFELKLYTPGTYVESDLFPLIGGITARNHPDRSLSASKSKTPPPPPLAVNRYRPLLGLAPAPGISCDCRPISDIQKGFSLSRINNYCVYIY